MKARIWLFAVALLAGCGSELAGEVGTGAEPILGGAADSTYSAVGVVTGNGGADFCTATLLESRIAVTAAHCTDAFAPEFVLFGDDSSNPDQTIGVSDYHPDPNWTGSGVEHDLSVLVLSLEPAVAPLDYTETGNEIVGGTDLTAVGYGLTALPNTTTTVRQSTTVTIGLIGMNTFGTSTGPCVGDGGAPAIYEGGATPIVLGTYGYNSAQCDTPVFERTDVNAAFIQFYIPTPTPSETPTPTPGGGGGSGDGGGGCSCSVRSTGRDARLPIALVLLGLAAAGLVVLRTERR